MNRKLGLLMTLVIILLGLLASSAISAEISVGVEEGDWIEYGVTYTGTPPEDYPTRLKMEVLGVQGTNVTLDATIKYLNGTQKTESLTIDLGKGAPDLVIIPADLNTGDTFYSGDEDVGDITISGVEERTYADARRTVVYASVLQIEFYWDKATGVALEATQSLADYTQNMKADDTNMWEAQPSGLPIDSTAFYVLIVAAIVIVLFVVLLAMRRRKQSDLAILHF